MTVELTRMIPLDEAIPLKSSTFAGFKDRVKGEAVLETSAEMTAVGQCLHCITNGPFLKRQTTPQERQSRHGSGIAPRTCPPPGMGACFLPPLVHEWGLAGSGSADGAPDRAASNPQSGVGAFRSGDADAERGPGDALGPQADSVLIGSEGRRGPEDS